MPSISSTVAWPATAPSANVNTTMVFATNFTMIRSSLNAKDYSTGPRGVHFGKLDMRHSFARRPTRGHCRRPATARARSSWFNARRCFSRSSGSSGCAICARVAPWRRVVHERRVVDRDRARRGGVDRHSLRDERSRDRDAYPPPERECACDDLGARRNRRLASLGRAAHGHARSHGRRAVRPTSRACSPPARACVPRSCAAIEPRRREARVGDRARARARQPRRAHAGRAQDSARPAARVASRRERRRQPSRCSCRA